MRRVLGHNSAIWIGRCVFCLIVVFGLSSAAWGQAQITSGVIQGTLTDESGGVVPGATVEVKHLSTNLTSTQTSDGDGRFVFLQLVPGEYSLTVTQKGYATIVQEKIPVTVGQAISLNLKLKVSGVDERVTVTAIPTVDTLKTESSTTLNDDTVDWRNDARIAQIHIRHR